MSAFWPFVLQSWSGSRAICFSVLLVGPSAVAAQTPPVQDCELHAKECGKLWDETIDAEALAALAEAESAQAGSMREIDEMLADYQVKNSGSDRRIAEKERERAAERRALAEDAEEMANDAWRRDEEFPGRGWDAIARGYMSDARKRRSEAEADEERADELDNDATVRHNTAERLRTRAVDSRRRADALTEHAEQKRVLYQSCRERHLTQCVSPAIELPVETSPPQRATSPPSNVCGPNITNHVVDVMASMVRTYDAATPATRKTACSSILSLGQAESAWDIWALAPTVSRGADWKPLPDKEYWFENISSSCAQPRHYPCGATVEFLGECIHPQVVNYVQWGVMNKLCDQSYGPLFLHGVRDRVHHVGSAGAHFGGQRIMTKVGESFVTAERFLAEQAEIAPLIYTPERYRAKRVMSLKDWLSTSVAPDDDWRTRPEVQCATSCELSVGQKRALARRTWSFKWAGLTK